MGLLKTIASKAGGEAFTGLMCEFNVEDAVKNFPTDRLSIVIFYIISSWDKTLTQLDKDANKLIRQRNKIADLSHFEGKNVNEMLSSESLNEAKTILDALPEKKRQQWLDFQEEADEMLEEYKELNQEYSYVLFLHTLRKGNLISDEEIVTILWKMFNFRDESFREDVSADMHKRLIDAYMVDPANVSEFVKEYFTVKAHALGMSMNDFIVSELPKNGYILKSEQ